MRSINQNKKNTYNRKRNVNSKKKINKKNSRIKRTAKKIKKKISNSVKHVFNKMKGILKNISKKIKINSIGRYMLYLKVNDPDKYAKVKLLGEEKFKEIQDGDKQALKDIEKKLSEVDINEVLEQEGGGSSWSATNYIKVPFVMLVLAYLYVVYRWNCKFGEGSKRYCP